MTESQRVRLQRNRFDASRQLQPTSRSGREPRLVGDEIANINIGPVLLIQRELGLISGPGHMPVVVSGLRRVGKKYEFI